VYFIPIPNPFGLGFATPFAPLDIFSLKSGYCLPILAFSNM
jgi:hypothetical protein